MELWLNCFMANASRFAAGFSTLYLLPESCSHRHHTRLTANEDRPMDYGIVFPELTHALVTYAILYHSVKELDLVIVPLSAHSLDARLLPLPGKLGTLEFDISCGR